MNIKNNIPFVLLTFFSLFVVAQDTIAKKGFDHQQIVLPAALIGTGLILKSPSVQSNLQKSVRNTFGQDFRTKADDYIQFAPTAQMLLGNYLGFKSENNFNQMLSNTAVSILLVGGSALVIKNATKDLRPDGTAYNSFPSGHTAMAFSGATLLFLEYKNSNIWYATSGYLFASATGVLRVANNRHWAGDVFAGAGLGIGIGTLVHYFNPIKFKDKNDKKTTFLPYPSIHNKTYGLGMLYQF